MTPEDRERFLWLCQCVQDERNLSEFLRMLDELSSLLHANAGLLQPSKTDIPRQG